VTAAADRPRDRIWNRGPSRAGPAESALNRNDFWKKISAVWGGFGGIGVGCGCGWGVGVGGVWGWEEGCLGSSKRRDRVSTKLDHAAFLSAVKYVGNDTLL
jgi:hypothetical protein